MRAMRRTILTLVMVVIGLAAAEPAGAIDDRSGLVWQYILRGRAR
jgi:hypothetical protein